MHCNTFKWQGPVKTSFSEYVEEKRWGAPRWWKLGVSSLFYMSYWAYFFKWEQGVAILHGLSFWSTQVWKSATGLINTCAMTYWRVNISCNNPLICVSWLQPAEPRQSAPNVLSYLLHYSLISAAQLIDTCAMNDWYVCHDSMVCVPWLKPFNI